MRIRTGEGKRGQGRGEVKREGARGEDWRLVMTNVGDWASKQW